MHNTAFERFGELFIQFARDRSIVDGDMIVDGRAKAKFAQRFSEVMASLNEDQREVLKQFTSLLVDDTLHNLLYMFEQFNEQMQIAVTIDGESVTDIRKVAAGDLQGYIFIWAEKYSGQRLSMT